MSIRRVFTGAAAALVVAPGAARADPVRLDYGAYFLGLRIADFGLAYDLELDSYEVDATYRTAGLVAWLRTEEISAHAAGRREGPALSPRTYSQRQTTPRKTRTVQMRWRGGDIETETDPPRYTTNTQNPVTAAHRAGARDLLSAVMQMTVNVAERGGEGCNGDIAVFNGKERYDLRGAYVDTRDVAMGGYEGPVHVCTIYLRPVAGYEPEDMPSERFLRTPINVWFGDGDGGPAPVRVSYSTGFGSLVLQQRRLVGERE